jgi:hypothetical protein
MFVLEIAHFYPRRYFMYLDPMEESSTPQKCNQMAGHSSCAQAILRSATRKQNGCPSFGEKICTCRHAHSQAADMSRAEVFLSLPAVALRYLGERKHLREKEHRLLPHA